MLEVEFAGISLCDGASRGKGVFAGPNGYSLDDEIIVEAPPSLRGTSRTPRNRGNLLNRMTLVVQREHNDVDDAEYFLLTWKRAVPRNGTLTLIVTSAGGATAKQYIDGAVLQSSRHTYKGCRTTHTFNFVGGELQTEEPGS